MIISSLFGFLTIVSLVLLLTLAAGASFYIKRLGDRRPHPLSKEIGGTKRVLDKARKREPMSADELAFAKQVVADRSSVFTFCIPGVLFAVGCYFVFGSLQQLHGATPSERTFLGVIPMLTSTILALRLLGTVRLRRRLSRISEPAQA